MKKLLCILMCLYPYLIIGGIFALEKANMDVPKLDILIVIVFVATIATAVMLGRGNDAFSPNQIAKWAFVIKLAHLPWYGISVFIMLAAGMLSFIPVPFMIFVGMGVAMMMIMFNTYILIHGGIYGLAAVFNAKKVGAVSGIWVLVFIVLQFIPGADLAALAYLYFKTRNCA